MNLDEYGGLEISQEDKAIAPGKYLMQYVSEEEMRNDRGWVGLKMFFQIQGPKHEGQLVSSLFTMANPNSPDSVQYSKVDLAALASACQLKSLKNTEELKGIRFYGMVETNDKGYSELKRDFGKGFSVAEQGESILPKEDIAEPKPVEVDPLDSEEIPF